MRHLINLIKEVELEMRSNSGKIESKELWLKLSELPDWDYRIIQDAMLRINIFIHNSDSNFVYKYYKNLTSSFKFNSHEKLDLLICCTKRDEHDIMLTDAWNRLYVPQNIKHEVIEVWGMEVVQARNFCIKEALKRNANYVLFIDDDIVAPNNGLIKLFQLLETKDTVCVAGNYYKKIEPLESAHHFLEKDGEELLNEVKKVDLCAFGFTLIDLKSISYNVPIPLFHAFGDKSGKFWSLGEDAFFSKNIYEYTKKDIYVDTSIECLHYDKTWKRFYGTRDKQVTYASNTIETFEQFNRMRVPAKYPLIAICIPTRYQNSPLATNLAKLPCLRGYRTELVRCWELPVDQARTYLVQEALKMNADYVLFIDDDVCLPIDGLTKLITNIEKNNIDIITGDYIIKNKPEHSIHLQLNEKGMVNELERIENQDSLIKSNWLIGLGCCLINIDLFKQAKPPWFVCHTGTNDEGSSEDSHLTEMSFINGFNVYIDKSIKCLHIDFKTKQVWSINDYDFNDYCTF